MSVKMRNTFTFIIFVNIVAWVTTYLATVTFNDNMILQQLFIIIFLLSPFITSYLLRTVGKEGWKNAGIGIKFESSKSWYIISILIFPTIITITYFVSKSFNINNSSIILPSIMTTTLLMLIPMFIKNIGEEFGWRGYLEPQLKDLGFNRLIRHTITGIVWAAWHLPIIFFTEYTNEAMSTYLPRFFIGTVIFAFVYGQLRDYSKTVWTSVLLHTIGNSLGNTLIASYLFASHKYYGIVPESYVSMVCWSLLSILLYLYNKKNKC